MLGRVSELLLLAGFWAAPGLFIMLLRDVLVFPRLPVTEDDEDDAVRTAATDCLDGEAEITDDEDTIADVDVMGDLGTDNLDVDGLGAGGLDAGGLDADDLGTGVAGDWDEGNLSGVWADWLSRERLGLGDWRVLVLSGWLVFSLCFF
jgi:hypothetical protein